MLLFRFINLIYSKCFFGFCGVLIKKIRFVFGLEIGVMIRKFILVVFYEKVYPMELSHDEVRRIAELAKLDLTADEVSLYGGQLSNILQYFQRLEAIDTSQVSPTASVLPLKNVLRLDVASQPTTPEAAVANAPDKEDNQFRVSAVLGEE